MPKVKIGFCTIFGYITFAMFIRIQCARINIYIRVKFLYGNPKPLACKSFASEAAIIPLPKGW